MPGSPLGILLILAAVYLVIKSPSKAKTVTRMVIAFVAALLLCMLAGTVLHTGDPRAWGQLGGLIGLLTAVIVGWWHLRAGKPVAS
jgi:hypothetical protein